MSEKGEKRGSPSRLGVLLTAMLLLLAAAMLLRVHEQYLPDSGEGQGRGQWRTGRGQRRHIAPQAVGPRAPMPEKDPIAELAQQLASSLARRELLPSSDPGFCAAILLEVTNSFALKQQAARALAAAESDTAFALALNVLTNAPSSSRAAMAEALGHSQRPESRTLLESLLTGADEAVARGAVRGVAARASPDALNQLGAMLVDGWDLPLSVRTEAALCLGGLDDPAATDVLKAAALEVKNTTVAKHVLAGLGNRPFAETESF
jgi:hypothetical protein